METLRLYRKKIGMSLAQLAQKISETGHPVHPDTLSKIERGQRRPSPELAKALETVTGIPRLVFLYPDEFGKSSMTH